MKIMLSSVVSLFVSSLCFGSVLSFKVDADKPDCLYRCGESAKISVTAVDTNGVAVRAGTVSVVFDNFGDRKVCPDRVVDLGKENPFVVSGSRATPGFLRLTLKPLDKGVVGLGNRGYNGKPRTNEPYYYGVAFEPERIEAGTPNPPDFDVFWADAIRKLEETVPLDPQVEPIAKGAPEGFNLFRVSFATCGGRRVYGWLVEPKDLSRGPFRGKVEVPGAGLGATVPTWAEPDTVRLLLNVHTYPQPESDASYGSDVYKKPYDRQKEVWAKPFGVDDYYLGGIHLGRERYFYYAAILGINRAVDWLAARPSCDPSRISYRGTSQGGGFGLYLTALNKHITRSCIFVPALTDLLGSKVEERESGWPRLVEGQLPEHRAEAEKWAPYFCGVNFARRITCPIRFVVGFADTVCPPHAGYAAYNSCPAKDKKIVNGIAMFHAVYGEFYSQLGSWQNEDAHALGAEVAVDFTQVVGPVKPVNGVGQPPMLGGPTNFRMMHYLKEAGIPYSRLHDVGGWMGGGLWVDIPNLFPNFDADENDPKSYVFDMTDALMKALVENKVEPYFRLGVTIENFAGRDYQPRRVLPPKDFAKWARICEHVIRHYTEGWANGFKMKITYWEIWNEPENHPEPGKNPMWQAPFSEYLRFYGVVAPYLKGKFPHLKIGGYGHCGFYAGVGSDNIPAANSSPRAEYFVACSHQFLKMAQEKKWPLDFFSYHSYSAPDEALRQVRFADEHLNQYGFMRDKCERHFNEWLPYVDHKNLGTAKQASGIAAELIELQNGPVDVACIYDARCGIGNYAPLFNPMTYKPHKAYYAFKSFKSLRKCGKAVRTVVKGQKGVYVTAAKGEKDAAILIANDTDGEVPVSFSGLDGYTVTSVRYTDAEHTNASLSPEEIPSDPKMPPRSFALVSLVSAAQ